jgi:Tfp pilus assembly PilM family ATPase
MKEASDAGLNVLAVEPSPLSLYAAMCSLSAGKEDASELTLLLNIGYGSGEITIGLGRDVWAVQEVVISEEVLRGALNDDGSVVSKPSVSSALESLIIDIEHSFKTVSGLFSRPDSLSPGRIMVSGPGALNKGIFPFLKKTFNINIELFDPLGAGPGLAAAVGLAMRGVKDEAV